MYPAYHCSTVSNQKSRFQLLRREQDFFKSPNPICTQLAPLIIVKYWCMLYYSAPTKVDLSRAGERWHRRTPVPAMLSHLFHDDHCEVVLSVFFASEFDELMDASRQEWVRGWILIWETNIFLRSILGINTILEIPVEGINTILEIPVEDLSNSTPTSHFAHIDSFPTLNTLIL